MYCVYFGEPAHPQASEIIRKHPKSCARTRAQRSGQCPPSGFWRAPAKYTSAQMARKATQAAFAKRTGHIS